MSRCSVRVESNRPRDRDNQAERRENGAMRYPARSEAEEFMGEAVVARASYTGVLYR